MIGLFLDIVSWYGNMLGNISYGFIVEHFERS